MGFFLDHETCSVKTIKKRAKDSPSSARGREAVSWWRSTVVHTISVFEKPSSAPDAPNETFREQATQGGECIPFGSPKICFTSMPLTITNNPFTDPKCPLFCTSCCLTNHMEKSCTSVPIPSQKDGVKQGGIENLKKKKKKCWLPVKPLLFCFVASLSTKVLLCCMHWSPLAQAGRLAETVAPPWPGRTV